jgi:hypothetical protein
MQIQHDDMLSNVIILIEELLPGDSDVNIWS